MEQSGQASIFKNRFAIFGIALIVVALIGLVIAVMGIASLQFSPEELIAKMDQKVLLEIQKTGLPERLLKKAASKKHGKDTTITDFERGKLSPEQAFALQRAEVEAAKLQKPMDQASAKAQIKVKIILDSCLVMMVVAGILIFKAYKDTKRFSKK